MLGRPSRQFAAFGRESLATLGTVAAAVTSFAAPAAPLVKLLIPAGSQGVMIVNIALSGPRMLEVC